MRSAGAAELLGHLPDGELDPDEELRLGLNDGGELVAVEALYPQRRYVLMGWRHRENTSLRAATRPRRNLQEQSLTRRGSTR
jgi:hypothetical protein